MKTVVALTIILAVATTTVAFDLGNRAPAKPSSNATAPPPDPEVIRQGGDTIADAVRLSIPTVDLAGTTAGYADDYDVECPYGGADAPDVVYSIVPEVDMMLTIDLWGSLYDTKVWVWDETLDWPIACNDDYYPDYTSKIERVAVAAGAEYFIVVDGYGGDFGDYLIDVIPTPLCNVDCPAGAALESEPPLQAGYVDLHNGGCNTDDVDPPLQSLTAPQFCGVTGWYNVQGDLYRDTDWFTATIPAAGVLEVTLAADMDTHLAEVGPQDCGNVQFVQEVFSEDCSEPTLTVVGPTGATVWLWVAPFGYWYDLPFDAFEYAYVLTTNTDVVATEDHSWTSVKALFD